MDNFTEIHRDIDREIYDDVHPVILEEIARLESELIKAQASLSNLETFIDFSLDLCKNLHSCWIKASFQTKQKLQHLMFPEGLLFDKVMNVYRTLSVNVLFHLINSLSMNYTTNEKGQIGISTNLSCSVVSKTPISNYFLEDLKLIIEILERDEGF